MKTSHITLLAVLAAILLPLAGFAQVNSGSDGHDGALNPTSNLVIDMADHPDGIYHYTSVNIPAGVTVSFIPNAGNKPVVWLVQEDCVILGKVELSGKSTTNGIGAVGGVGGWKGGSGSNISGEPGQGPGGGSGSYGRDIWSGGGSYGGLGGGGAPVAIYGNSFLLPMLGGSGGGGSYTTYGPLVGGGGGGGGAILIAASSAIQFNGVINATGGLGCNYSSGGSGGAVRLVTNILNGTGTVNTYGGNNGGFGRIRIDATATSFGGFLYGVFTQGFQPIIIPAASQGIQLAIQSLSGIAVPASPSGVLADPDVIIPAQQANPIPVVVRCTNIPLNTEISVVVHPANGPDVQAVGLNNVGTAASSTATISLNMPRGGGIIYAKAVTGIAGTASASSPADSQTRSLAETGWTADGERFKAIEVTATLGGKQQLAYISESGKRYPLN